VKKILIYLIPIPFIIFSIICFNHLGETFNGVYFPDPGYERPPDLKIFLPVPIKFCDYTNVFTQPERDVVRLCHWNYAAIFYNIIYWTILSSIYLLLIKKFKKKIIYSLIFSIIIVLIPIIIYFSLPFLG
jgi:hypothetical protein